MLKHSIPIEIGGKKRQLRYTWFALESLENEMEIPILEIAKMMASSVKLKQLKIIIWAGLLHEDKDLTLSNVGEWLEITKLAYYGNIIRKAFELAFPRAKEAKLSIEDAARKTIREMHEGIENKKENI